MERQTYKCGKNEGNEQRTSTIYLVITYIYIYIYILDEYILYGRDKINDPAQAYAGYE